LASVLGIAATALRAPSPRLALDRAVADLTGQLAQTRLRAVRMHASLPMDLPQCDDDPVSVRVFPDGTAEPGSACLAAGDATQRLRLDPLTARLEPVE
jgi:hypothetical protein